MAKKERLLLACILLLLTWASLVSVSTSAWGDDAPLNKDDSPLPARSSQRATAPPPAAAPTDTPASADPASDPADPGPKPHVSTGTARHELAQAWRVTEWERGRLAYSRAAYLKKAGQARLLPCLPEGTQHAAGADAGLWRDRVDSAVAEWPEEKPVAAIAAESGGGGRSYRLPATESAQDRIFRHQHPASCKDARFLVWKMWNTGLGADLHTLGQALGYAMAANRVLLLDTRETWWYGMDRETASLECFFVPLSNCTLADAGDSEVLFPRYRHDKNAKKTLPLLKRRVTADGPRTVTNPLRAVGDIGNRWSSVPFPEWAGLGYQWWMAQTTRYILRREQPWMRRAVASWVTATFGSKGMPAKIIGIHVRHGDKYKEMRLLPLAAYMSAAEELRAKEPDLDTVFLSTENDAVLEATKAFAPRWKFYWTKHLRSNKGTPMDYAMLVGPSKLAEVCAHLSLPRVSPCKQHPIYHTSTPS